VATAADVRALLAATTVPAPLVDRLLDGAPPAWMLGSSNEALAADLALCHPPLRPDEVRASVLPTAEPNAWRLTVATPDRPGVLATTCAVIAAHGLTLTGVSAATWPDLGVAVHSLIAVDPDGRARERSEWDALGATLRAGLRNGAVPAPAFRPATPVRVGVTSPDQGHCLVSVEAPDQIGLLWAISHWLTEHDCTIESVTMMASDGTAQGSLLASGVVDTAALAEALGGRPAAPWRLPSVAVRVASRLVVAAAAAAAGLAIRSIRVGRHPGRSRRPTKG
jgi:UTP:GlnB (protein PII) uridylyltransferase